MSQKMTGSLILIFLVTSIFIEVTALFALWNSFFKIAIFQWALWTAGMMCLACLIGPAWQRYAAE